MQEYRLEGERQLCFYFAVAHCLHLANKKRMKQPLKVKLLFQGWRKWRLFQTYLQRFLLILGFFFYSLWATELYFFAFISVSSVVSNYYSRVRQWKQHKLELSSLSYDHEYFSVWFSSLIDHSRSFMWDGDSNKVMALKKCFHANVIIFWLLEKYFIEMWLKHRFTVSRRISVMQGPS